jgi:two-component system response regulator HydG
MLLSDHFVHHCCAKAGISPKTISSEAQALLSAYNWPGNVRELENTIERAVLLNRTEVIDVADLPERLHQPFRSGVVKEAEPENPTLESIEKAYIHYVMSQTKGKKAQAARILGIDTSTLYRKLERYGLKDSRFDPTGSMVDKEKADVP